jgi:uncharacterized protein (DUF486 family)
MTTAWYWHLNHKDLSLWKTILISWAVAFFEYCLAVPANRWGSIQGFNAFQLKITQEVVTLIVFTVFAVLILKEPFHWKYLVAFGLLLAAVYIVFKK